jgi:hypothetical protein
MEQEKTTPTIPASVEMLINSFDECIESNPELDANVKESLSKIVTKQDELMEGLPALLEKASGIKSNIDGCDRNIKNWQESKALWTLRSKAFAEVLGKTMEKMGISTLKNGKIKLAVSSRTSLEVDEDWLINLYQNLADVLQAQLPDYIRVKLALDKNKLSAHLKQDNSLILNNPDKIHDKTSKSVSIK